MNKKKKIVIIAGIVLGVGVLIAGIVFAVKTISSESDEQESLSDNLFASDQTEMFTNYDCNELLNSIKKENYYDKRSGFVFHVPDGFTVDDKDEYLILKNSSREEGCIVVYLYSDMTVYDGVEMFDALYGLKERTEYYVDNHYHKCVLYDVGIFSDENTNGNLFRVEKTQIHLKDADPAAYQAVYYHTAIEGSGVCVGSIVRSDAQDDTMSYFNDQAHEVLNNITPVHYLGDQPGGNAEYMSLSVDTVNGMEIKYPTGWDKYKKSQNCIIYKAKTAKYDQYQRAAILVTKIASDTDLDIYDTLKWELGYLVGDALCQNSEIENYFTFSYLILNTEETVDINGLTFEHATCTGKLDLSEAKKLSTLPVKDNVSVDAYFTNINNTTHCFLFIGSTVRNNVEMEILSRRCLEYIH